MNVPKLRFKDNNGNDYPQWKKQNLGNISDITKLAGFEFTEYVTYQDSGNIIALRGLNVKNNTLDLSDVKYIDNSDFSKLSRSKLYINDLLFTYVGTIGEVALINQNDKYYLAPNVCRIRHYDNVNAIYLLYIFNSNIIKREIYKYLTKSSQPALSMENIRKFKVSLPCLEEQNKIANFLSTVDKKISNIEDIITNLENQKKGLLQQTFSQKIRFKDENCKNSYTSYHLHNLIKDIKSGNNKERTKTGLYPVYGSMGILGYNNNYVYNFTSLLIARVGINAGKVSLVTGKYDVSDNTLIIIPSNKINIYYLYYYLINFNLNKLVFGSGQPLIKASELKKIIIQAPCLEEQTKIADFLSAFDRKIDNQKAQLEHWKQIKKGLLQQMFV